MHKKINMMLNLLVPLILVSESFASGPLLGGVAPDVLEVLSKERLVVTQQADLSGQFKNTLLNAGRSQESSLVRFLLRLDAQIYALAGVIDGAVYSYGKPSFQSYKTRVCSETANVIATSKAMVRLLKEDGSLSQSRYIHDFENAQLEMEAIKEDLQC